MAFLERYALRYRGFNWGFFWDKATGLSYDYVNYGPFNCSSSSWIVPGTIEEGDPIDEPEYDPCYEDEYEEEACVMRFTYLELITIERALEEAARQYEREEYVEAQIKGHGHIAVQFKKAKMDAKRLAKRIRQYTTNEEAA